MQDSGMSSSKADYFDSSESMTNTERALAQRTGRVLAAALSATQARLKSEVATVYGASSEGLGARAAELLTQALSSTRAPNAAETEIDQLTRINQQVLSTALNSDTEKLLRKPINTLNAETALATVGNGFYDPSLVGSTPRSLLTLAAHGDGGAVAASSFQYRSSAWARDASYQNQGVAGYHLIYSYRNLTDPNTIESAVVNTLSPVWFKDGLVLKEKFSDAVGHLCGRLRFLCAMYRICRLQQCQPCHQRLATLALVIRSTKLGAKHWWMSMHLTVWLLFSRRWLLSRQARELVMPGCAGRSQSLQASLILHSRAR